MLHRFLHNKTAVGTVTLVLLVALMGIFAPLIARTTLTPPTFSTNLPTSAENTRWAPIIWGAVSSPA